MLWLFGAVLLSAVEAVGQSGDVIARATSRGEDAGAAEVSASPSKRIRLLIPKRPGFNYREFEWKLCQIADELAREVKEASGFELALQLVTESEIAAGAGEAGAVATLIMASPARLPDLDGSDDGWRPVYAIERSGGLPTNLVAVARKAAASEETSSWNRSLVLFDDRDAQQELAYAWFVQNNVRLGEGGEGGVYHEVVPGVISSGSRAVHTVFFGRAYACVVRQEDFNAAAKRNPQISEELQIVGAAPPLIGDVIAIRQSESAVRSDAVELAVGMIGRTVPGRKAMRLLGWSGLRPMSDELDGYYESSVALARVSGLAGDLGGERVAVEPSPEDGEERR